MRIGEYRKIATADQAVSQIESHKSRDIIDRVISAAGVLYPESVKESGIYDTPEKLNRDRRA